MLASDKPYISSIIVILYAATCIHCFVRTAAISRESDRAHRVLSLVSQGGPHLRVAGQDVLAPDGTKLPPGHITTHIRNIILKAGLQGGRVDQTTAKLFALATDLTEVFVVSALEREQNG